MFQAKLWVTFIAPANWRPAHEGVDLRGREIGRWCIVGIVGQLQEKVRISDVDSHMARFYASALKHDLEVLLLAATSQLQSRLKTQDKLSGWRLPPEDQNQSKPPKRIVEELFSKYRKGKSYNDVEDGPAILRDADLCEVAKQCPVFRAMIDWIGEKTGVPGH